ncbi:MAG: carbohydrate binding domain-containing protein, partial [Pirellulales bacterium]
ITANTIAASGGNIYGRVQATSISGGTYRNSTTQVPAADLPTMPDWSTVFDYYRNNGTEIPITFVDSSMGNLVRNGSFSVNDSYWTGTPTGAPAATITRTTSLGTYRTGAGGLRVSSRAAWNAGAAQPFDAYVKGGQSYQITAYINHLSINLLRNFRVRIVTKGTGSSETTASSSDITVLGVPLTFLPITATVTAPAWSGDLEYAYVIVSGGTSNTGDFYVDDVTIQDTSTGRFIFRETLGPGVNSVGGSANAQGLYWIDCQGNRIVIERSRIKGTLLLINPGAGSMIGSGPINWSPSISGYPALMVDADTAANADFTIAATNRPLSEGDDGVNYNPAGMSHEVFGTDSDLADTYPSEIQGLILVRDDLTFQNNSLVRGSVIVGDQITATSGSLDDDFRPDALYSPPPGLTDTPKHLTRPLSMRKLVGP